MDSGIPGRSIQKEEFLPSLGWMMHLGGLGLAVTIMALVALAATVRYDKMVRAQAIARPLGELRLVQAPIEGTIAEILVQENQTVTQNQPIAILEHSQLKTQQQQIQTNLQQNQLQIQQLANQLQQLDIQSIAEANTSLRSISVVTANLEKQERDLRDRQLVSQADLREAQAQLAFAQEEMQRYQQLTDTGAIALIQVKAKEEAFHAAEAKRDRALAQTNPSAAPITAAQATIQQQRSQGEASEAKMAQEKTKLLSQRLALQQRINQDRLTLQQLQQDQKKPILKAPISGQLHQLMLRNVGQYIPLGQTIAQISPQNAPLLFKARISAEEISQIKPCFAPHPCNQVTLRIAAYPYPEYGVLLGKITAMTPDVIEVETQKNDNPTGSNPPLFYEVTIEPDRPSLTKDNQSFPLKPGMAAIVEISTQQETFLSFLLKKARLMGDRN